MSAQDLSLAASGGFGAEDDDVHELADLHGEQGPEFNDDSGDDDVSGDDGAGGHMEVEDNSMHSFEAHGDAVLAVAWSPVHADLVATAGQDDKAYIWRVGQDAYETTEGTLSTHELAGHTDSIDSIAFSSQGTLVATGGLDGVVKLWDASNGKLVSTLEGPGEGINWLCWHPKGNVILAGSEDMTVWMWLAQTGQCMQVFTGHSGNVTAGTFTADGKTVITVGGEGDASLRAWNPRTGECTQNLSGYPFHDAGVTCLSVHPDGLRTVTGAEDGSVRIANIGLTGNNRVLASIDWHEDSVECVGWAPHLPLLASTSVDSTLRIWDVNNCSIERSKCEHPDAVTKLAWHSTQPLVFTACADGVARCWDLRTGAMVRQYTGHTAWIQDLALSPDGSMLLTGSDDATAKVFTTAGDD